MSILYQTGCAVIVCYTSFMLGIMYAWPSSTVKIFSSVNTTLHRPMHETEIALFGSLSSIGAFIITPLTTVLLDNLGRKYSCLLSCLAHVVSWSIVVASNRVEAILATVFISGFGAMSSVIVPVFISEFCQDSIRGMMTSGTVAAFSFGMLISYLLGGCLDYNTMNYTCLCLSVAGVVMLWPLSESPLFLMKKGLEKDAAKAIAFYRHVKVNSEVVMKEMKKIRRALNPDLEDKTLEEQKLYPDTKPQEQISKCEHLNLTPEEEKLNRDAKSQEKISKWQFFKKSRSTRRALLIVFIIQTMAIFQGLVVILVYAQPLLEEAIPNMSATLSSVLLAIATVVASCSSAYLVDTVGRRVLMIYSSIGAGVCCLALGTQIHLHWGPHWISSVFVYLFCIMYTFGAGTIPTVLATEVFLPEIKSLLSMICVEWSWVCNFMILFIFNPLVNVIGLGQVFYIFSGICFGTAIFCVLFLPETKGLTVNVIQTLFIKKYT